jgi:hypothetical protein
MKITTRTSTIRTLHSDDDNFWIRDNFILSPRAGFEIGQKCPEAYESIIKECIQRKWLKPIAYVTEQELMIISLGK